MASLATAGRVLLVACFFLVLETCSAVPTLNTVRLSELAPQTTGILAGLSPLIRPVDQYSSIRIYYPGSTWNGGNAQGRISYEAGTIITFTCLDPTQEIVVNANPLWDIYPHVSVLETSTGDSLLVHQLLFNIEDDTLHIKMMDNMKANGTYMLSLQTAVSVIDEDDRFGIQAINRTNQETGEVSTVIQLSSAPKAMRHFIPCFDNSEVQIPYSWSINVHYGDRGGSSTPAIAVMNGQRSGTWHYCPEDAAKHYSQYSFSMPKMAVGMTELEVLPFSGYQDDADQVAPPSDCE